MTIHFNGLFDSQLNITMHTTRLRAHSSLIMMSNHHNTRFSGSSCIVELAVNQLPCFFFLLTLKEFDKGMTSVLSHFDTQFRTHFTNVTSGFLHKDFCNREYCRNKSNFMTTSHPFPQSSIFHIFS